MIYLLAKQWELQSKKLNTYWQNKNCFRAGGYYYWELINQTIWQNNYAQTEDCYLVYGKLYTDQL